MAMTAGAIRAGRAYVEIFADDSKLSRDLRRAAGQLDRFGSQVQGISARVLAGTAAIAAPMAASVRVFAAFDDQMRQVKAVTGATADEFQRLTEQADQLGANTSFTNAQAGGAQAELGRAGFKTDAILAATPAVLSLARATGVELPQAAGVAAAVLKQFGLDVTEATRVTDRLTYTANNSFNTLPDLAEALKYVGTTAADQGYSLEQTLALLGALGNVDIRGSMAGTTLKRLMVIGAAEAEKLEAIFGMSFRDAAGNAMPVQDMLQRINIATKDLGTSVRTAMLNEAFGLLGITGASAIGKAAEAVEDLRKGMTAADGIAKKTADEMDAGIGGAMRKTSSAIMAVATAFGDGLSPALTEAALLMQGWATEIRAWIKDNQKLVDVLARSVVTVAGGAAVFLSAGMAIRATSFVLGGLTTAAQVSAGAMALLTGQTKLTGVALVAAKAGMFAAAATAGAGLGMAIVRLTGIYGDLNGELRKTSGLFDALAKKRSDRRTAEVARYRDLATVKVNENHPLAKDGTFHKSGPDAARAGLARMLEREEKNQASINQAVIDQRARVNNVEPGLFGNDLLEVEQRQLTELEMQAVDQKALIESIKAALSEVDAIEAQQQAQQKLQEFQAQQMEAAKVDLKPIEERVAGTFSGRALDRMSAAGIIRYAQETAHNTAKMVDGIADVAVAVNNLQQNWGP